MSDGKAEGVELAATGGGGVRMAVRVRPGGRANRLVGVHAGALKVEVTAAPERGKANAAVTKLLAGIVGVRRSDVEIVGGHSARIKTVVLGGVTVRETADRLRAAGMAVRD